MDDRLESLEEPAAASHLTISAPSTPDLGDPQQQQQQQQQQLPGPSPASVSCHAEASVVPPPLSQSAAYSPAWETKSDVSSRAGISPTTSPAADERAAPRSPAAFTRIATTTASTLNAPPPETVQEHFEGPVANLQLQHTSQSGGPPLSLHGQAMVAGQSPAPGPSPSAASASETHGDELQEVDRAFFGASTTEDFQFEATVSTPVRSGEGVISSPSVVSGIFELEIGSPLVPLELSTTIAAEKDAADTAVNDSEDSAVVSSDSAPPPETESIISAAVASGSPTLMSGPWGRIAPSPEAPQQPLQGPWGRLQEVMDEIKVMSPHQYGSVSASPSANPQQEHPPARGPSPTSSAEERKGFAATGTRSPRDSSNPLLSPFLRSPVPVAPVTSPPTPAPSAGNTPADTPTIQPHMQRRSQVPSVLPGQPPLLEVEEQPQVHTGAEAKHTGANLGAAPATTLPAMAATAFIATSGSTSDVRPSKSESEIGDDDPVERAGGARAASSRGSKLELDPKTERKEEQISTAARDIGGRGYVGQRFIRAAEALSDSPQLRRAAGAAATVVSAAAGTARVHFNVTSRAIGKVLVSSAKPFEDFVDEQLRQDGSGLVLRREGATGLLVPRGKTLTQTFVVAPGCCICWEFRVKDHDLGFALRRRSQGMGGSTEEDIFELKRYPSRETFQGRWTAEGETTAVIVMVWDNSYSCLRPKTLAYKAHVLRPGADSTGPPPPPPPTPAQTTPSQPTRHTFGSIGSGRGGEHSSGGESSHVGGDTEAFAVDDESEGEAYFSSSKGVGRGGVLEAKGGGEPRDVTQSRLGGGTVSSVDEGSGGGDGGKDGENGEDGRVVGGGVGGGGGGT